MSQDTIWPADCGCRYPCSCVSFRGEIYGSRDEVIAALVASEHRAEGREAELEKALQGFLDAWLNCDRTLTEGDWEEMDEAEREARTALAGEER